ncbi:MAG TPA: hypothetical protein VGX28_05215 [Frankiaceae bacterium]|nr:hypothetical protein [Frankiaceae bacterium]
MDRTTRRDAALALVVLAVLVGVAGVFVASDPWGLVVLRRFDRPGLVWAAVWLFLLTAVLLYRPRRRVVLLGALPFAAAGYLTGMGAMMSDFGEETTVAVLRVVRTPDYEVRLVETDFFFETGRSVRVRTRDGLLSRERVVWTPTLERPVDLRLVSSHEVEIELENGAVAYASF